MGFFFKKCHLLVAIAMKIAYPRAKMINIARTSGNLEHNSMRKSFSPSVTLGIPE